MAVGAKLFGNVAKYAPLSKLSTKLPESFEAKNDCLQALSELGCREGFFIGEQPSRQQKGGKPSKTKANWPGPRFLTIAYVPNKNWSKVKGDTNGCH